jgi:hypothetical protein
LRTLRTGRAAPRVVPPAQTKTPCRTRGLASSEVSLQGGAQGTRTDSASALSYADLGKSANPFGTESGTVGDETGTLPPDLAMVVSAWAYLSEDERKRRGVLLLIPSGSLRRLDRENHRGAPGGPESLPPPPASIARRVPSNSPRHTPVLGGEIGRLAAESI